MQHLLKLFALFGAVLLAQPATFSRAQTPYVTEPLTNRVWESLAADQKLKTCTSVECVTLKKLLESFEQLGARDFPNSMATDPGQSEKTNGKLPIVAYTAASKPAQQEACRLLVSLAANVNDLSVTLHALEIATLLEASQPGCLRKVVAATPVRVDGAEVLPDAQSLCETRGEPYCDQLRK